LEENEMKNAVYAQSGGVTSVINASAYGTILACLNSKKIDKIYAALNGIDGIFDKNFVDLSQENLSEIEKIPYTPGAMFGSCRTSVTEESQLKRIIEIFGMYNIGYFFYNGGNDSMDTIHKIAEYAVNHGYDLKAIGIPKTVDNDLEFTDHCPGYGSAAKFTATALLEATRDVKSMSLSSTKVFIFESMGRHAGWLAASGSLASINGESGPKIILLPEIPFENEKFLNEVEKNIRTIGYCSIVASEALSNLEGNFISVSNSTDSFGNVQLGKIAHYLENLIKTEMNIKVHTGLPDYLQRSSRHISSLTDWKEAIEVGSMAVLYATYDGLTDKMVGIVRDMDRPYIKHYESFSLDGIAAHTKKMPREFIREDGFNVNEKFLKYAQSLIEGEAPNLYVGGVPVHANLKINIVPKK